MNDLEGILNMLDCGVVKIVFDGNHRTVRWANDAFYSLTGSTRKEYENELKSGNPRNVLHPDDFERVFAEFAEHVQSREPLSIQYRVLHRNGSVVWLDVLSSFAGYEDGKPCFINIMRNITELKKIQELREYEFRRYQLICELSSDLLFEYDLENDRMTNYLKTSHDFDMTSIDGFFSDYEAHGLLTEDGIMALHRLFFKDVIENKQCRCSEPVQIMTTQGCKWFTVTCGIVNHVIIGKLRNVDEEVKLVSNLRQSAQSDGPTGLLNKAAMIRQASHLFRQSLDIQQIQRTCAGTGHDQEPCRSHAMVVLDIDDFKQVNDTFGHSFGDEIIQTVAECIKESFRQDDLKGRFGGDEFVVVIKNVNALTAQLLIRRYRQNLADKLWAYKERYPVTSSIGISLFPQHGKTFDELFQRADSALYQVKRQGKNQTALFSEDGSNRR